MASPEPPKKYFFKYLKYLAPYKGRYVIHYLLTLVGIGFLYLMPLISKIIIDDVLIKGNAKLLYIMIVVMFIIVIGSSLIGILDKYLVSGIQARYNLSIKKKLYEKFHKSTLKTVEKKDIGTILTIIEDDSSQISGYIFTLIEDIPTTIISIIYVGIISFTLSWKLTLLGLIFLPFLVISQHYFGNKLKKKTEEMQILSSQFLDYLQEKIRSFKIIRLFSREKDELDTYTNKSDIIIKKSLKMDIIENLAEACASSFNYLNYAAIMAVGGFLVISKQLTIGELIAITTYINMLIQPIIGLAGLYVQTMQSKVYLQRVDDFEESLELIKESEDSISLENPKGIITFKKASFRYEDKLVIDKMSFQMDPGIVYGLVGPSGSGKTTILNLIYRFYDVNSGAITIDGVDIRKIKLDYLKSLIAVADVESVLFNATIEENLKYGNLNASNEEIIEAAKLANIHDFIMTLPKKYLTPCGEIQARFSEGQKQRLSLARVILKNSKIILFDESTASLDSASENSILEAIFKLAKMQKTILIIAHRLSTIRAVDKILVLSDKRIVEDGRFQHLIKKKGKFFEYFNLEFRGYSALLQKIEEETKKLDTSQFSIGYFKVLNIQDRKIKQTQESFEKEIDRIFKYLLTQIRDDIDIIAKHQSDKSIIYIMLPETNDKSRQKTMAKITEGLHKQFPHIHASCKSITVIKGSEDTPANLLEKLREA